MPSHKPVPASIRYVKARLKSLMRPAVWGSSAVLLLMILFGWEYFTHPEWLKAINNDQESGDEQAADLTTPDGSTSSQKDIAAIGADIDSSPVLQKELEQSHPAPPITMGNSQSQAGRPESLFDQSTREQSSQSQTSSIPPLGMPVSGTSDTSTYKQNFYNPFVSSAQDLLNSGPFTTSDRSTPVIGLDSGVQNQSSTSYPSAATNSPLIGVNSFNSANRNQSTTAVSPLEAALNQTPQTTNSTASSAATQTPAYPSGQTLSAPTYTGQTGIQSAAPVIPSTTGYSLPPNTSSISSSTSYPDPTQPQSVPGVPPIPTTPSVAPVTPSYTPSYNSPYQPQSGIQPSGVSNSPYQPQSGIQPSGVSNYSPYTYSSPNQGVPYSPYTYSSPNQGVTSNVPPLYSYPSQNQGQYNR